MDLAMDGEAFVSADQKAAPIAAAAELPDLYFFGLPGVGKSFCGEALQDLGYLFHDGDGWLPMDLRQSLREGRGFTEEQRDRFVQDIIERIGAVKTEEAAAAAAENRPARPLCVAQATFKQRHRDQLRAAHPSLQMVWVQADEEQRWARLRSRVGGVDEVLGRQMAADFELPTEAERHVVFCNDWREEDKELSQAGMWRKLQQAMPEHFRIGLSN
ncbi:unnamed protein product [Effrenium voratum]|uniref:Uncharacterized protein n=1 Tax=Effrenium voratum TaxID=2562239 RepID=A0AA36N9U1_9DINO|nr:unnamed protein product [Effrenium voratum]